VLVQAQQDGIIWGLGTLSVPLIDIIFVALHWKRPKRGFLMQIVGFVLMWTGFGLRMNQ
jgi:hypothetical protein